MYLSSAFECLINDNLLTLPRSLMLHLGKRTSDTVTCAFESRLISVNKFKKMYTKTNNDILNQLKTSLNKSYYFLPRLDFDTLHLFGEESWVNSRRILSLSDCLPNSTSILQPEVLGIEKTCGAILNTKIYPINRPPGGMLDLSSPKIRSSWPVSSNYT